MSEGADAADGVAQNARRREKHFASVVAGRVVWLGSLAPLSGKPCVETIRLFDDQKKSHVCVLIAAKFCTSSFEHSYPFGSKKMSRRSSGNQIFLAVEIWYPEAVDYIRGRELQEDGTAHR